MATDVEIAAMRRAIALSGFGLGTTSPNPPVGCVILNSEGHIVGEGFHERKGEPHAEGNALAMAGDDARGGTAVVTLEPCNHEGRAPACRRLLTEAGIARCVIAVLDPSSREEGGAQRLRDGDLDVELNVLVEEAELVLGPWLHAQATQRPHVTWTYTVNDAGIVVPLSGVWERQQRASVDAVISQDGTITEGLVGSHGSGVLDLRSIEPDHPPHKLLARLHSAGVRVLLLNVTSHVAAPYLGAGVVDRVEAYLLPNCVNQLPTGIHIVDIRKMQHGLLRLSGAFC